MQEELLKTCIKQAKNNKKSRDFAGLNRADDQIRTGDLILTNHENTGECNFHTLFYFFRDIYSLVYEEV